MIPISENKTKKSIVSLLKFYIGKCFLLRKAYKPKYLKRVYFSSKLLLKINGNSKDKKNQLAAVLFIPHFPPHNILCYCHSILLLIKKRIITGHKRTWEKVCSFTKTGKITSLIYKLRKWENNSWNMHVKYIHTFSKLLFPLYLYLYVKDTVLQKQIAPLDTPAQLLGMLSLLKP